MTILAVGILVLGGLFTRSARSADATGRQAYQAGMIATEAARNDALPFNRPGCRHNLQHHERRPAAP